jgi:ribonuclease E
VADNENLQAPNHDLPEEPQPTADSPGETKDVPAPERLRVHSLARTLGTTSRRIIDALLELDGRARSAHSTIGREEADRIREALAPPPKWLSRSPKKNPNHD